MLQTSFFNWYFIGTSVTCSLILLFVNVLLFFLLISSFMPSWSEKTHDVIYIILYLWRFDSFPSIYVYTRESCMYWWEDSVFCSEVSGKGLLGPFVQQCDFLHAVLLIFHLNGLSIDDSGMLKSPTFIVLESIPPFSSTNLCCNLSDWSCLDAYTYYYFIFFLN